MDFEPHDLNTEQTLELIAEARAQGMLSDISDESYVGVFTGVVTQEEGDDHLHVVMFMHVKTDQVYSATIMNCLQYHIFCEQVVQTDGIGKKKEQSQWN